MSLVGWDANLKASIAEEAWEYAEADTQAYTHGIHRYSGKFIPQIASRVISLLTRPGELIVDPYCGSGTTLVEATLLGRHSIGIDLNPLAVLIAKTKITPIQSSELRELEIHLRSAISGHSGKSPGLFDGVQTPTIVDGRAHMDWFRKWFQPHVLRELIWIKQAIESIELSAHRRVAEVAFSEILRRSSNAHSGYPNVMLNKNASEKPSPIPAFFNTFRRIAAMVGQLGRTDACWEAASVLRADARSLPIPTDSVDAVVTHPPYIGSIPYAEYGVLSLGWMGVDSKQLDARLTGGKRQKKDVVNRFEEGYRDMLAEVERILKPGRGAFVMVGNPVVKGALVDLAQMTIDLGSDVGLSIFARATREGINRRANKMGAEHLIFFKKRD